MTAQTPRRSDLFINRENRVFVRITEAACSEVIRFVSYDTLEEAIYL